MKRVMDYSLPKAYVLKLILLLYISIVNAKAKNMSSLEKLFDRIFLNEDYNNLVRPEDMNGLTQVQTELKLLQIDLDEKYQQLISTVWLEMSWQDDRLSWNKEDFEGIQQITLPTMKIWVPDIVLQNGVGQNEYLNEFKHFNPWISHKGLVTWVPEVRLFTKCVIKVKDFPFDTQCCEINFYSWAHTSSQMTILQFENKNITNITHLSYNTEWNVYDTCALNKTIQISNGLKWWVTSYIVYIKRESIYHFYTLLMPCTVLSVLSVLLFMIPPDSDEKITLGVTLLLAFFVNSLVVSNYTPEAASELPVIGVYYTFNIFLVATALSGSVLVLRLHFRGHKLSRAPIWLLRLFLIESKTALLNLQDGHLLSSEDIRRHQKPVLTLKEVSLDYAQNNLNLSKKRQTSSTFSVTSCPSTIQNDSNLHKLSKILRKNFQKLEEERLRLRNLQEVAVEWKEIARRLDYVFLLISLTIIIISPFVLFGEFLVRDITRPTGSRCGCDHTFI